MLKSIDFVLPFQKNKRELKVLCIEILSHAQLYVTTLGRKQKLLHVKLAEILTRTDVSFELFKFRIWDGLIFHN